MPRGIASDSARLTRVMASYLSRHIAAALLSDYALPFSVGLLLMADADGRTEHRRQKEFAQTQKEFELQAGAHRRVDGCAGGDGNVP